MSLLVNTVANIFLPSISCALTSGPSQPEFSSFSPVSTAGMVDQFTGDFNYSIPVLEVPGPNGSSYPLSLSYHSGANPEEEASWVGYGWTLNPGAINRGTRGFPDDYDNETVKYWNKVPKNWTATIGVGVGVELFSTDNIGKLNATGALRYNNNKGFGTNYGIGVSLGKGLVSLGYNGTDEGHSFTASINPMALLSHPFTMDKKDSSTPQEDPSTATVSKQDKATGGMQRQAMQMLNKAATMSLLGGNHGMLDYGESNRATQVSEYTGASFNVGTGVQGSPSWLPAGVTANVFGTYSYQENVPETDLLAAGYMYSAGATSTSVSDYYTEKASSYNTRDIFLGIPFNNADVFSVSGEGIGGAFRLHHDRVGEFTSNRKKSSVDIANISVEFDVPISPQGNLGIGYDGGVGRQSLEEGSWSDLSSPTLSVPKRSFSAAGGDPEDAYGEGVYFQFANELTANPEQQNIDDRAVTASLVSPDFQNFKPQYGAALLQATNQSTNPASILPAHAREKRGSYIGYHTREQMRHAAARYCRSADVIDLAYDRVGNARIGELSVVNEQGRRYTYGLPLYSSNEKNLQYGAQGTSGSSVSQHGFILYNQNQDTKIGEEREAAYAATYLLTEATTPDYVDRTLDGPSDDDFGGFTKFNYKKMNSLDGTPYHWRLPYTGHVYERNSLSDPLDDMGSVSEGDKEIAYLYSVHTKTHTAIFQVSDREDGRDADNSATARNSPAAKGDQSLYKLHQIDLYSNGDIQDFDTQSNTWKLKPGAKPLKTVKFQYTYELCPDVPNSWTATDRPLKKGGKLTLSRVWFEYQGQVNTKVNPYEFTYRYPTDFSIYPAPYQNRIVAEYGKYNRAGHANDQNPGYRPTNVDAWGNYQFNPDISGNNRYDSLKTWVNQRPNSDDFDPAAWQLKVIKLPSKAEIHVQYEQDDYAFVQGEMTHALASLYPGKSNGDITPNGAAAGTGDIFYIDPKSVGVAEPAVPASPAAADAVDSLCTAINTFYGPSKRPIFFKFLYSLVGSAVPEPTRCNTDYVSGYVNLRSATVVQKDGRRLIKVEVGNNNSSGYSLPYQVCQDFVKTQRRGKLSPSGNCDPQVVGVPNNNASAKQIVQQMASYVGSLADPTNMCVKLNPRLSYFKIPVPFSKKGGGVRVRRLLTYAADPALDNEAVLYGSEYIYKLVGSKLSSGVATNEPAASRGENPLVQFIPRRGQTLFSKIISGEDRKQSEGPLGESVLPAPSVGYSRVIERSIHSGKTNPGFTVSEFFTAHDYPVRYENTTMERRTYYKPGFGSLVSSTVNNEFAAQGFSVVLNSMHGQPRRTATYAGDYAHINDGTGATLITEQVQEYFMPDQAQPVRWNAPGQGDELGTHLPGRDVDLTLAQHAVKDLSLDASMEFDNTFGIVFFLPIPFVTARLSATKNEAAIYTHVTSKVVRYPAIVKSVRMYKDGIYHLEENLALDQNTGKPVAVRSQDEFQGTYLKEDVMAAWLYPEKQSKAQNEGIVLAGTGSTGIATATAASGIGSYYLTLVSTMNSQGACDLLHYLHKGDLVEVNTPNSGFNSGNLFISGGADYARNRIQIYPTAASSTLPANSSVSSIRVVNSGNTNELALEAGSTTYHKTDEVIGLRNNTRANNAGKTAKTPQNADFLQAFNTQLGLSTPTGVNHFTLGGPYEHMDVSGFYNRLPSAFRPTVHDMKVQNLVFVTNTVSGTTKYTLVSFEAMLDALPGRPAALYKVE